MSPHRGQTFTQAAYLACALFASMTNSAPPAVERARVAVGVGWEGFSGL